MSNKNLRPLILDTNYTADHGVLSDLLRCYGYQVVIKAEANMLEDIENLPQLRINWDNLYETVILSWAEKGNNCSWQEIIRPFVFEETIENRRRRVLRLGFHHLLIQNNLAKPNPWGILTGVRPTKIIHRFIDQGISEQNIRKILDVEYGMQADRIDLIMKTINYQRPYLLTKSESLKKISLYIGFPFCPSRCSYCSFPGYDITRWHKWIMPCIKAMLQEIEEIGKVTKSLGLQIQSIYFGGGTPTSMPPEAMLAILSELQNSFNTSETTEWTIEGGRPETINLPMLEVLAEFPISRICINPQSMQQATLDKVSRIHSISAIESAFNLVRNYKGLANCIINSDLILGLPGEGVFEINDTLDKLLALNPENITVHNLAIKRGSAYKEKQPNLPNSESALSLGDIARTKLTDAGYVPYYLYRQKDILALGENIGYTLLGQHCLYNIHMMEERQTIIGIGVGSGSKFLSKEDWSLENNYNPKDLIQYIERISELVERKVDKLIQIV